MGRCAIARARESTKKENDGEKEILVRTRARASERGVEEEMGKRRKGGARAKSVHFSRDAATVIGRADADVDRTPRGEPARCSCCGLHVVGYAFGCAACACARVRFELCAMCFGAHAHLSRREGGDGKTAGKEAAIDVLGLCVHGHSPDMFIRTGDEDQMALDEILSDRRLLMVNGRGASQPPPEPKPLSRANSGRSSSDSSENFDC